MLNRRQLRIKALQSLYAYFQSENENIQSVEKQLVSNFDKLYDLYIYQLSFLTAIHRFAEESIEISKNKFIPTEEDLNPNIRFVQNKFINQLLNNRDFLKKEASLKINWSEAQEIIRKIVQNLRLNNDYIKYMKREKCTYEMDKDIILMIINEYITNNDALRSYYEEINSMWSEDFYMAISLTNLTIYNYKESNNEFVPLPPLFKINQDNKVSEDLIFVKDLVKLTIDKKDDYDKIIDKKLANWEFERIAAIDLILIRMGMVEIFNFPTIPLKVTLNEIIELAKHFSSPRSGVFVNGLLDRTIAEGLKDKTIIKEGRGLVEK